MKIDWDKDTAEWRVFNEWGAEVNRGTNVVISGVCELVTDHNRHGWCVTAGTITKRGNTLFITQSAERRAGGSNGEGQM